MNENASQSVRDSGAMPPFDPATISRPDSRLLRYYIVIALLTGPMFPVVMLPLYFKYETLKYRFDDSGIAMSWGILFRKEIYLTYRRIQDIHLTRNLIQRWFGLATVAVQTASGNASAEMSIEGVLAADELRDYLYARMRGARGESAGTAEHAADAAHPVDEPAVLLREIRDALRSLAPAGESAR
jgi:putative membrane protein